jgi:hypothetical protein
LLLLPFLLPLLVLAGVFLLLHAVPVVRAVPWFLADSAAKYCIRVAKAMALLPFAELSVPKGAVWCSFAVTAVFCLAFWGLYVRRRRLDLFKDLDII